MDRLTVTSADGTPIAVWIDGSGPPLVLVHGAISDHTNDQPFVDVLRGDTTTFAVDRRGRGGSGDSPAYSIEREFEDVSAVVDEVSARTARPVTVWGHSYGADVAMGAAARNSGIENLVLYEPGLGIVTPRGTLDVLISHIENGELERATLSFLADIVGLDKSELDFTRSLPTWSKRVGLIKTVPRELAAEAEWIYGPDQFGGVTARTLVLAGSESPPEQSTATQAAADAIPDARVKVLAGQSHMAHRTDPEVIAQIVLSFMTNP